MARLTDPHTGSLVNVDDEFAKHLIDVGYRPEAEGAKRSPGRRHPAKKSDQGD